MVEVKITKIERLDNKYNTDKVYFEYQGKSRYTLATQKVYEYLRTKTDNFYELAEGMMIDVTRTIKPSRNNPAKHIELYRINKVVM